MNLKEIRNEIDEIDRQLLPLFMQRMDCAKKVAAVKKEQNLPVLNTAREQEILEHIQAQAGEYGGEARILFSTLMDASRALQHKLLDSGEEMRRTLEQAPNTLPQAQNIACQGVAGAYSHKAAAALFPGCTPVFHETWGNVFEAIANGDADLGLLPVENSSAGSVSEVYDLILKYRFYIVAAYNLHVRHCLAAPKGACESQVKTVYSHPQGLNQCSDYLAQHNLSRVPYSNTAAAAQFVSELGDPHVAAICSHDAAANYGLAILRENVQNNPNNCTRFVAISRSLVLPENANKISLCFSLPHTTGSLYGVLSRFAINGLNLTKIESRPIAGRNFEYDFYLDFTGNIRQKETMDLIASLQSDLPRFSFLGNYMETE